MTSIQLIACIGMVTGFFILLRLSPMEFTDGVFRRLTSRPKSLKDEINELTHRKKKSFLRREIADTQNILKMTGREAKFPAICAMSLLLFVVGASAAIMLGNFFLVPVLAVGMMFVPFWFIKLTASYQKQWGSLLLYACPFTDRNDCCMSHHSNPARGLVIREAVPIFVVLSKKDRRCNNGNIPQRGHPPGRYLLC